MASTARRALADKDVNAPISPLKLFDTKSPHLPNAGDLDKSPLDVVPETRSSNTHDAAAPHDALDSNSPNEQTARHHHELPTQGLFRPTLQRPFDQQDEDDHTAHSTEPSRKRLRLEHGSSSTCEGAEDTSSELDLSQRLLDNAATAWPAPAEAHERAESPRSVFMSSLSSSSTLADRPAASAAEQLRLKLRFAMFKVQNDRIETPLSRLELESSPASPKVELLIKDPPEETIRAFRRASRRRLGRRHVARDPYPRPHVNQTYTPALLPPRPMQHTQEENDSEPTAPTEPEGDAMDCREEMPSTPQSPQSPGSSSSCSCRVCSRDEPEHPTRMPPADRQREVVMREYDLTSSAVKGRAADSLLSLVGRG